ncbi:MULTISPECIES: hypothetical protein [unclassified Chitinophaga]|uniref:hypothetical protein n=1 Tax=unclassified Chitinophaga TaxID=2619133 RepID=UPI0015C3D5CC|nr:MULTISPECIES: hypothetical protein [unclassified Chitinophaga]WPV65683.1 hypothetical protein QQL36_28165 [Chitinophaga sp. LS1]
MNRYSFVEELTVLLCLTAFIMGLLGLALLPEAIITGTNMLSLAIVASGNKNQD